MYKDDVYTWCEAFSSRLRSVKARLIPPISRAAFLLPRHFPFGCGAVFTSTRFAVFDELRHIQVLLLRPPFEVGCTIVSRILIYVNHNIHSIRRWSIERFTDNPVNLHGPIKFTMKPHIFMSRIFICTSNVTIGRLSLILS